MIIIFTRNYLAIEHSAAQFRWLDAFWWLDQGRHVTISRHKVLRVGLTGAISDVVAPSPAPRSRRLSARKSSLRLKRRRNWPAEMTNIDPLPNNLAKEKSIFHFLFFVFFLKKENKSQRHVIDPTGSNGRLKIKKKKIQRDRNQSTNKSIHSSVCVSIMVLWSAAMIGGRRWRRQVAKRRPPGTQWKINNDAHRTPLLIVCRLVAHRPSVRLLIFFRPSAICHWQFDFKGRNSTSADVSSWLIETTVSSFPPFNWRNFCCLRKLLTLFVVHPLVDGTKSAGWLVVCSCAYLSRSLIQMTLLIGLIQFDRRHTYNVIHRQFVHLIKPRPNSMTRLLPLG